MQSVMLSFSEIKDNLFLNSSSTNVPSMKYLFPSAQSMAIFLTYRSPISSYEWNWVLTTVQASLGILAFQYCMPKVNMLPIAEKVEKAVENLDMNIKVAVMGCAVNGPGEAREADFGVACGDNCGLLFKKGEIVKKVKQEEMVKVLKEEILEMINNK